MVTELDCGHVYHKDCIKETLMKKNECPNCDPSVIVCEICEEFVESTHLRIELECGHTFHDHCVRNFMVVQQKDCPSCQKS